MNTLKCQRLFKGALLSAFLCATVRAQELPPPVEPTGPPPGVVVGQSPDPENSYLGSPSLAILADGTYLASHDIFGKKSALLHRTWVYQSKDKGKTWSLIADLPDQFWSTLFVHRDALYLLGTAKEYGDIVIRRSTDGGHTWTTPADESTGLLFRGWYHCGAMPVIAHHGRLWRAVEEYVGPDGTWDGKYFKAIAISAPEDADLLRAANWSITNGVFFSKKWIHGARTGWLEGNVVTDPEGRLVNIMRLHTHPSPTDKYPLEGVAAGIPRLEAAAMLDVGEDGKTLSFDPEKGFFHFPGSQSKFAIRYDPVSGRYWSLVNKITNPWSGYGEEYPFRTQRNVLMLTSSKDLRHWDERSIILRWKEGLPISKKDTVAFQYADWQIDGDDMVALSRTAWGGANGHNSNYITFHRIENFRDRTMKDSPPDLAGDIVHDD